MKSFTNSGQFKKGIIPWNKDKKTGIKTRGSLGMKMTDEAKKKIGESVKLQWAMGLRQLPKGLTAKGRHWKVKDTSKMSASKKGEKHWRWIKDRTKVIGRHNRSLHDPEYKQWRKRICDRDGWKCKILNSDCKGRLEVHHILGWKDYPKLRYEVNNGITLCHFHHPRKRNDEVRLSPYFQELIKM